MPKIKHVSWRDGRPRFAPGKALRARGHKGQDLKHADGRWFSEGEALDWSNAFARRLKREAKAPRVKTIVEAPPEPTYPLSRLFHEWLASPRIQGKAAATIRDYRQKSRVIETHDPLLWSVEAAALDQTICYNLFEELWSARGLATARGALRILSIALKWGMKTGRVKGLPYNPARDLEMEALEPRARFLTRAEFDALVKAAEDMRRIDVADLLFCGAWTGQRQADRLKLKKIAFKGDRFTVRQQKTGQIVNPPVAKEYRKRLNAAEKRRAAAAEALGRPELIDVPFVHLNEVTWAPWNEWTYRNLFAEVRAKAAKIVASCSSIMEKDLRATAVTWMALAGCTLAEICAVSGHSLQSAHQILKHYLAIHPEMASSAIGKLVTWYEANGETEMDF